MAGSTFWADSNCPEQKRLIEKMTTASSGGAVFLHYVAVSTNTGEVYHKSSFFLVKFPQAELATMQNGKFQENKVVNGLATWDRHHHGYRVLSSRAPSRKSSVECQSLDGHRLTMCIT